jgi:hypothetical protein
MIHRILTRPPINLIAFIVTYRHSSKIENLFGSLLFFVGMTSMIIVTIRHA